MRLNRFLIPVILAILCTTTACSDQCDDIYCATGSFGINLQLLSAADSSDLLFGPVRKYDPKQIRVYSLNGGQSAFHSTEVRRLYTNPADSVLTVSVSYSTHEALFFEFEDGAIDTLGVQYMTTSVSECCGEQRRASTFSYNGAAAVSAGQDLYVFRR